MYKLWEKMPESAKVCSECGAPMKSIVPELGENDELNQTVLLPLHKKKKRNSGSSEVHYISPEKKAESQGKNGERQRQTVPNRIPITPAREKVKQIEVERKKNKGLFVALSVLGVLVIVAIAIAVLLLFAKPKTDSMKIQSQMEFGGHSYALFNVDEKVAPSWDEAKAYCESLGGYLAIINSEDENQAIYELVCEKAGGYALFGYSDELSEGTWLWVDGQSDSGYINWGVDSEGNPEPNAASVKEDYAEFTANRKDGSWNDTSFGQDTFVFVCEWDAIED